MPKVTPKVLYHATWDCRLASIQEKGLIPNFQPNNWLEGGQERSKGRTFLCAARRREYWEMTMYEWLSPPVKGAKVIWLRVDCSGWRFRADHAKGENYEGDYWTKRTIPPSRIQMAPPLGKPSWR